MKKLTCLLMCAAMVVAASCGGNNSKKAASPAEAGKADEGTKAASSLSIGDKFAFAGLESNKLVPSFALEIAELQENPRSESNPAKDEAFFWTGPDITAIPAAKVQDYLQQAFAAVKKAADGGVVYYQKGTFDNQRGGEVTEAPTTDKPAATVMYLYQHNGTWYYISVGHKAFFRKFSKDYGEKFIGVGITVKEILGDVEVKE